MANEALKKELRQNKIAYWQLAEAFEISETTMTRWFRRTLPEDIENRVRKFIAAYKHE